MSLVNELKGVDLNSIIPVLKSLQEHGLVSLLGSDENTLVKLIPAALSNQDGESLMHKGVDFLGGLFK